MGARVKLFDLANWDVEGRPGYAIVCLDNCIDSDGIMTLEVAPRPTRRKARAGLFFSGGNGAL